MATFLEALKIVMRGTEKEDRVNRNSALIRQGNSFRSGQANPWWENKKLVGDRRDQKPRAGLGKMDVVCSDHLGRRAIDKRKASFWITDGTSGRDILHAVR
jgi:hypothetical protein